MRIFSDGDEMFIVFHRQGPHSLWDHLTSYEKAGTCILESLTSCVQSFLSTCVIAFYKKSRDMLRIFGSDVQLPTMSFYSGDPRGIL